MNIRFRMVVYVLRTRNPPMSRQGHPRWAGRGSFRRRCSSIVAILVSQASIGTIVQVAKAPGAAHSRRVRAIEGGHLAPAYPALGAYSHSGRLRPSIHPAFFRCRKAGANHTSWRSQRDCCYSRKPGQQWHHCSGRQSARGNERPRSTSQRRRT